MKYQLPDIRKADVEGKKVFVRADLDVPFAQQSTNNNQQTTIVDDTRLKACLPTIEYLLQKGATVIIGGKLGRPEGESYELSLRPVAEWLAEKFKVKSSKFKVGEFDGWKINDKLFLLENLRFYPEEEKNDEEFAEKLARLANIYVNEAFAMSHRINASIVAITQFLPHYAGFRLTEEVKVLSGLFEDPKRPLVVIIGGKKIETKLPLVTKMDAIADYVLVGGKIAQDREVFSKLTHTMVAYLISDGRDITEQSAEEFLRIIKNAQTIVWNGPMGLINEKLKIKNEKVEHGDSANGTWLLAQGIVQSGAYTIAGGGDTIEFLNKANLLDKFDFVSTGGGAMLAFLSGEKLPALEALK